MLSLFPATRVYLYGIMTPARVEVDLYSGRPNPIWDLTAAATQSLLERCDALPSLPRTVAGAHSAEGLGYRGLKVDVLRGGRIQRLSIGDGKVVIKVSRSPQWHQFRDPERQLERWLLQTGLEHLDPDLYRYLLDQTAS